MSAWDDGFDVRRELKRTAGNRHLAVGTVYGTTKCRAKSAAKPGGYTREKQPAHATVQPAAHLTGAASESCKAKKGLHPRGSNENDKETLASNRREHGYACRATNHLLCHRCLTLRVDGQQASRRLADFHCKRRMRAGRLKSLGKDYC